MKNLIAILLCGALMLALTGCAGTTVVVGECTCPPAAHENVPAATEAPVVTEAPAATEAPAETQGVAIAEGDVKTGLAIVTGLGKSAGATADANGKADFDVTIVAVTVDGNGVIRNCVIDSVGASAEFDATGAPVAAGKNEVLSKKEQGFGYGMVAYNASAIGKEWFEQADALAAFAMGKTMDEVKAGITGGYASDVDLATSASIYLGGYVGAMEVAVANAKVLDAKAGQNLNLGVIAQLESAAGEEAGGTAKLTVDAVALTMDAEGVITSSIIDSLQAEVAFDGTGAVVSDLSAPRTKNEQGFDYGMVAYHASAIGKEWFEQVENFCTYITGKTPAEVADIAVTVTTAPEAGTDLATGTTIAIGGFQALIAKAAG